MTIFTFTQVLFISTPFGVLVVEDTYFIVVFEIYPLVTVDSVVESKGTTTGNDSHFKIENVTIQKPLKKLNRNSDGYGGDRTLITNFGNSHIPAYEAVAREHNEKVGRVELVIDYNHAYYGGGRKLDGHSSIHYLGHGSVNVYDRWRHWVKALGLSDFSHAEVYPKVVVPVVETKPYGNGMGNGTLVTNFNNRDQGHIYSEAVKIHNKTANENEKLWISHVAYDSKGRIVKYLLSLRRKDGPVPNLSNFWQILENLRAN